MAQDRKSRKGGKQARLTKAELLAIIAQRN